MITATTDAVPLPVRSTVTASDGVALAVHAYTDIDPQRPTVLAVHGYPDNHRLWDGVAEHLAGRYNLVAYDVRGAGESGRPARRSGYRFDQLTSDLGTVIDSHARPSRPPTVKVPVIQPIPGIVPPEES